MQPLLFKAQMWKLLDRCDWDGVRKILSDERNNSSSSASVRGSGSMHHNLPAATKRCYLSEAHARLPLLSYALWKRAPEDVVWRIMELSPRSVTAADSRGRLPLHVACLQSASPAVVDGLLDKKPFAALQADEEGNIPLHYAIYAACCRSNCHDHSSCGSWNSDNGDVILGRGVEPKDVNGRYCRTRSSRRGNTMLSAKCHYLTLDEHLDIVSSLLVVNPASALVLNNSEEAPLDMASELDDHEQRHVYTMISNVSQTFNFHVAAQKSKRSRRSSSHHHHHHKAHGRKARHSTSSSFTLPSSSYLMEMSASCFFQEDEEEVILFGEEQSAHYSCAEQARGEKPPRRMAYANVLEATHGLRTIRSL